ncbi:hypothetical protein EYF80_001628 [Liparis tanakae]|uniref:Uncharacterized protein n=1 Tax=Liparis tanakae TaxID=230148 RepID=A0A4Z2JDJ4_9TELE|nr:hypothetical protein EYF80_001628 [Liparis tanakae]
MAVLHLGQDEGVAAAALLHAVLLALGAGRGGQQVSQVGEGQGQLAAHVRGEGTGGRGRESLPLAAPRGESAVHTSVRRKKRGEEGLSWRVARCRMLAEVDHVIYHSPPLIILYIGPLGTFHGGSINSDGGVKAKRRQ